MGDPRTMLNGPLSQDLCEHLLYRYLNRLEFLCSASIGDNRYDHSPSVITCCRSVFGLPACTMARSISYCLPGMSPYIMITASSTLSSIRINTRCQGVALTFTESPFARASVMIKGPFLVKSGLLLENAWSSSSSSSAAAMKPTEASEISNSPFKSDERMKVADTEVISLTLRFN